MSKWTAILSAIKDLPWEKIIKNGVAIAEVTSKFQGSKKNKPEIKISTSTEVSLLAASKSIETHESRLNELDGNAEEVKKILVGLSEQSTQIAKQSEVEAAKTKIALILSATSLVLVLFMLALALWK